MRGSKAQIRIFEENKISRKLLLRSIILYNICALIIYLVNREFNILIYLLRSVPEASGVYYLYKISTPVISSDGKTTTLVNPGTQLSGKGHVTIVFDFLFVSMLVKLLLLFSSKFWLMYILVIVSCCYEFVYKPFVALRSRRK